MSVSLLYLTLSNQPSNRAMKGASTTISKQGDETADLKSERKGKPCQHHALNGREDGRHQARFVSLLGGSAVTRMASLTGRRELQTEGDTGEENIREDLHEERNERALESS